MDRPVKLVLSRAQMYSVVGYQPLTRNRLGLSCDAEGRLTAVTHACENITAMSDDYIEWATVAAKSLYDIPSMRLTQRLERVNTNLPTPIRAPIEGPGTWPLESAMDEIARVLEIDPVDLRLANYAETEPADGRPWSSKKLREAYHDGARLFGWRERASKPRRDGFWYIGHGMATCTTGTFRFPGAARVRICADGSVIVETGTHDIGTGTPTIVVQIVANEFGIDPGRVSVRWGETNLPTPAPLYGSAATLGVGSAVLLAVRDAKAKLARLTTENDLAAAIRGAGMTEVVGDGAFALPNGAEVSENGAGTPYAMRTWGAIFVEVGVDPDLGIIACAAPSGATRPAIPRPRAAR
ncbi:MAG: xanthine dehydrogenase family protein molybdopterin-binding subunit [Thermoleophilaceae bacterium]